MHHVVDFSLSKEVACVGLIAYDGHEINPTILVRTFPHTNNRTIIQATILKPVLSHGQIADGSRMGLLEGKHYSLHTTPDGAVIVVWSDARPHDERKFQPELERVAKALRGVRCLQLVA